MKRNREKRQRNYNFVCAKMLFGLCIVYLTFCNFKILIRLTATDNNINSIRSAKKIASKPQINKSSKKVLHKTNEKVIRETREVETPHPDSSCLLKTDSKLLVSVSLVIHSTIDRLWLMEETCHRWKGPIVLVVYFHQTNAKNNPWMQVLDWKKACPQVKLIPVPAVQGEEDWQYPVNKLRNIGLNALETQLFLMMDVDFLPSENLEAAIQRYFLPTSEFYSLDNDSQQQQRIAMVVPAFERKNATCSSPKECQSFLTKYRQFIPRSFEEIGPCVKRGSCEVFHAEEFLEGHLTTGTESWLKGDFSDSALKSNIPRKINCFTSYEYEPYVVLPWCNGSTPYYDERFFGYGKNKIEYISHLRFLNYSFHVLPEGFLVHYPHPKSKAHGIFRRERKYGFRKTMDDLYVDFLKGLNKTYGQPILRQCESSNQ